MYSIQTKMTFLTVSAMVAAITVAALLSVSAVKKIGDSSSRQILLLMCETGEKNLDACYESVEQSVETVAAYVSTDLDAVEPGGLEEHVDRVRDLFEKTAYRTNGVLTYYYRIDPSVSDTVEGFWYVNLDGTAFQEHQVTDICLYNTQDTSALVWFTVPKATGQPVWLHPYITDNLDVRVISYNVPIYWKGRFIGVVGMEIDYETMAKQVNNIQLYENGYAFITDGEGDLIYHPHIGERKLTGEEPPPDGLLTDSQPLRYTFHGVDKLGVWLPLENGLRLYVAVPISEINGSWQKLIYEICSVSAILLLAFVALTMEFTGRITKPLRKLTEAARQVNDGNYDFELDYDGSDEVGILTRTFTKLARHLKAYIQDLSSLAYADALTSVRNKGAYDIYARDIQAQIKGSGKTIEFAVGVFDCDNLKYINDQYGHDKGDIYLKTASAMICRVFKHSPVFRTGGDEFTVILQNEDYQNRVELARLFGELSGKTEPSEHWEQVNVSMGIAVFDAWEDSSVGDVARRADKLMYENKRRRKARMRQEALAAEGKA